MSVWISKQQGVWRQTISLNTRVIHSWNRYRDVPWISGSLFACVCVCMCVRAPVPSCSKLAWLCRCTNMISPVPGSSKYREAFYKTRHFYLFLPLTHSQCVFPLLPLHRSLTHNVSLSSFSLSLALTHNVSFLFLPLPRSPSGERGKSLTSFSLSLALSHTRSLLYSLCYDMFSVIVYFLVIL